MMADDPAVVIFQAQREQYFDVLYRNLALTLREEEIGRGFAHISAAFGDVRVFFEHERGLCHFSIGPVTDVRPLCAVVELASRFPRLRALEGSQRLSLEEQRSFLEDNWQDPQLMFSPQHLPETRRWHAARLAAYTKKMSGRS